MSRNPGDARQQGIALVQQGRGGQAVPLLQKAVQARPQDPETLHYLGLALAQSGRFADAVDAFRKSLSLHPDSPPTLFLLAGALANLGRMADAIGTLRKLLRLQPNMAEAHVELGNLLSATGEHAQARTSFETAIKLNPGLAAAHYGLGRVLHALGGLDEAIAAYRKALSLDDRVPQVHFDLAQILVLLGRTREARQHYRRARQLKPDYVAAVAGEAETLEWEQDYEGAWKLVAPLIKKGIQNPTLGRLFGNLCGKIGRCEEARRYLEGLLARPDLPDKDRRELSFVLGKLLDRQGDYDAAFASFERGNRLMLTVEYDPVQHAAFVDRIMEVFSADALSTLSRSGLDSELPIFIVGMPRSGTSLTEQILASHRDVAGGGELPDIHRITQALAAGAGGREYPACVPDAQPELLRSLAESYLKRLEEIGQGTRHVTDKMPQNFLHLGLIALLFPRARIIHCRRDARDVCLSIYFQNFSAAHGYANDLENIGRYYRDYERLMGHWKLVLDTPVFDLRYEGLVEDFEGTVRRLLEFCGLDWDPACLDFHKSRRIVGTASYDQVRQNIYKGSVGRWQHYEKHLSPLLKILGLESAAQS